MSAGTPDAGQARKLKAYRRGWRGESIAALLLRLKGYRILARRHKTPVGEIDLVARRGRVLAFVEVKVRADSGSGHGAVEEAITPRQRARIERAAAAFLSRHPGLAGLDARFDAVLVGRSLWPRHIADAWRP